MNENYTGSKEGFIVYEFKNTISLVRCGTPMVEIMDEEFKKRGKVRKRIWLRDVENENSHYLNTKISGAYETAKIYDFAVYNQEIARFDDTLIREQPDGLSLDRKMMVGGKNFAVQSLFANESVKTPMDKLLSAVDMDQNSS